MFEPHKYTPHPHATQAVPDAAPSIIFAVMVAVISGPDDGPWEAVHPDPPPANGNGAARNLDDIPDLSLGEDYENHGAYEGYVGPRAFPPDEEDEFWFDRNSEDFKEFSRQLDEDWARWDAEAAAKRPKAPGPGTASGEGVTIDDFRAFMEMHAYIFTPSGAMWPAASVNSRIPPISLVDKNGKPLLDDEGKQKKTSAARGSINIAQLKR